MGGSHGVLPPPCLPVVQIRSPPWTYLKISQSFAESLDPLNRATTTETMATCARGADVERCSDPGSPSPSVDATCRRDAGRVYTLVRRASGESEDDVAGSTSLTVFPAEGDGAKTFAFARLGAGRGRIAVRISELDESVGLGHEVWRASLGLSLWLLDSGCERLSRSSVLEFGCGCGLPSMVLASLETPPLSVTATDLSDALIENFERNLRANASVLNLPIRRGGVSARRLNWDDALFEQEAAARGRSAPSPLPAPHARYDLIIGADLVYNPAHARTLVAAVCEFLSPGGTFVLMNLPERRRIGWSLFLRELRKRGAVTGPCAFALRESSSTSGGAAIDDLELVIFKKYLPSLEM